MPTIRTTSASLDIGSGKSVEGTATHDDARDALGSVLNHVCLHPTADRPGGQGADEDSRSSRCGDFLLRWRLKNFAGLSLPFIAAGATGKKLHCVAVEPASCPTLTKGVYAYDYGDTAKMAPISLMYTLGHDFMPPGIHAGGLRYHGESRLVSQLCHPRDQRWRQNPTPRMPALRRHCCFPAARALSRHRMSYPMPSVPPSTRRSWQKRKGREKTILLSDSRDMGSWTWAPTMPIFPGHWRIRNIPAAKISEAIDPLSKVSL